MFKGQSLDQKCGRPFTYHFRCDPDAFIVPAIDQFLKAHLFGDIFQRDVLDWHERELATIAALANIKGVNGQLQAHYAISMNNGLTPEQLHDFETVLETKCGSEVACNAKGVLDQALNAGRK